jgi:hypothetical protein
LPNDLFWCVGVLCDCLDLLTLLNLVEEHFRGFGGQEWAEEQCVAVKQQHCIRLAVEHFELLEDQANAH